MSSLWGRIVPAVAEIAYPLYDSNAREKQSSVEMSLTCIFRPTKSSRNFSALVVPSTLIETNSL